MTIEQDRNADSRQRKTPSNIDLSPAAAEVRAKYMTRLEFCAAMRIGETRFHEYVRRGLIKTVKVGRTVLVPVTECDALILRIAAA